MKFYVSVQSVEMLRTKYFRRDAYRNVRSGFFSFGSVRFGYFTNPDGSVRIGIIKKKKSVFGSVFT